MRGPEPPAPGLSLRALALLGGSSLLVAGGVFLALAWNISPHSPLVQLDMAIGSWLQAHRSPALAAFLYAVTQLNSTAGIGLMTLVLVAILARMREGCWVLGVVLSVGGGMLLNLLLKDLYERARPALNDPLVVLTTYSFPSGHTAGATAFYGVLAAFLVSRTRHGRERANIVAAAAFAVALVAFSRVYLGAHYPSDVVAATASSCVWLVLCLSLVHVMARRELARPVTGAG